LRTSESFGDDDFMSNWIFGESIPHSRSVGIDDKWIWIANVGLGGPPTAQQLRCLGFGDLLAGKRLAHIGKPGMLTFHVIAKNVKLRARQSKDRVHHKLRRPAEE
jgi:hypothetical protein